MLDYKNPIIYKKTQVFFKNKKSKSLFNKFFLLFLLLFLILIFSCSFSKKKNVNNINKSNFPLINKEQKLINNSEGYYINGLYEKNPLISILIPHFDIISQNNINSNIKFLETLLNQSIKDIEIILSIKNNNTIFFEKIFEFSKINQQIKIFKSESDIYNNTIHLVLKSKGKFISVLNKNIILTDNSFYEKLYNLTYGKIFSIYEYKIENEKFYLIKNKILKDIIDNEISFNEFNELEKFIKMMPNKDINYISISFCLDNKYILYSYVSMISILETKNCNTFVSFYIIVIKSFSEQNKNLLLSLYEQYDFLNISFIYMDDRFKNVKVINYLNQIAYYRLSLGELLPNLNKIIYLDSDVLVYEDLTNLFKTNFNGYMILSRKIPKEININEIFQINTGVLLLNLKKMREIKFEENVLKIINKGFISSVQDQGLLIKYYLKFIGELNEKYNVPSKGFYSLINDLKKNNVNYKNEYLTFISNHPAIRHFNGRKSSNYYINSYDWWYFARKSKYYSIIIKYIKSL